MANLLARVNAAVAQRQVEQRYSADTWLSDYLQPWYEQVGGYGRGLNTTYGTQRISEVAGSLPGYLAALRTCPPAFAAQMVRALTISQARFTFRNLPSTRTPRRQFGTSELGLLERPWPNGTTGDLLSRMEWHAGCAGNAFVVRRPGRLRVLRPDWVTVVYGSEQEPDDAVHALDGEVIGYVYTNGGLMSGNKPQTLLPSEVAHWSPLPDPEGGGIGMSWITPAVREIQGDRAATDHKLMFFKNGATPNLVVKGIPAATKKQFDELVEAMEETHAGVANAYRTLYLTAGADASVVGADLKQIDFKQVQGGGETRIAMLSRVHPVILASAEGLQGSSLNAGNFGAARRMFADGWIYPTLQGVAAALSPLLRIPNDAELWFDAADMPILREDAKDAADIVAVKASTIRQLVDGGFDPNSAVAAVNGQDMTLLQHTGLLSVQLVPPGGPAGMPPEQANARNLVEMIQKVYLGVGKVITVEEARELLNTAGAGLTGPPPEAEAPAPQPAIDA